MTPNFYSQILALEFHWRFEQIHPFQDGNGRVGRILLNAWLLDSFFMPVIFFSENHHAYSSCIAASIETRKNKWGKYFVGQVKKTVRRIEEYKKEGIIKGGSSSIGRSREEGFISSRNHFFCDSFWQCGLPKKSGC
ncbi:MAG: Fic family protein [Candidatus Woesearchaeota archaeon]